MTNKSVPAMALQDTWAAVIAIDAERRINLFNAAAETLIGCRAVDVIGRHVCDVLGLDCPMDDGRCRWQRIVEGVERRTQPRETALSPEGCRVDVLLGARSASDPDGQPGAVLTLIDLTYHHSME